MAARERSSPSSSQSFASSLPSGSGFEQTHLFSLLYCSWFALREQIYAELPHYYCKMPLGSVSALGCPQETLSMIQQLTCCQMLLNTAFLSGRISFGRGTSICSAHVLQDLWDRGSLFHLVGWAADIMKVWSMPLLRLCWFKSVLCL